MAEDIIPAPAPAPAPIPSPWYEGADADTIGHIQNRGWHDKDAKTAALEAVKAHREAERFLGIPKDQIVRVPTDAADEAGWKTVYSRLGAPDTKDGYDLSGVKFADGTELDQGFSDFFKTTAAAAHLPKEAAATIAREFVKFTEQQNQSEINEAQATLVKATEALKTNWGNNYEGNLFVAKRAAAALGVTPEAVAALEKAVGYDKVMEMFRNVGSKIGEDKFITSETPGLPGVKTKEGALAELKNLKSDEAWAKRLLAGDRETVRQFEALSTLMVN